MTDSIDLTTIQSEPLEWPNQLGIQSAYDLGAERMRATILAVIAVTDPQSPATEPKCETCQDTRWSCIVETDDGDFMEDVCPDCAVSYPQDPSSSRAVSDGAKWRS